MFRGAGRKKLRKLHSDSRVFLDLNPQQKANFSAIFIRELEALFDTTEITDFGEDVRYFPSRLTEVHGKLNEKDFGNLYKQISRHAYELKLKYGNNSETAALNFLAGLMLSMMMTQPTKNQTQIDAITKGADAEVYIMFRNFSSELFSNVYGEPK